jgi:hypothetical protein
MQLTAIFIMNLALLLSLSNSPRKPLKVAETYLWDTTAFKKILQLLRIFESVFSFAEYKQEKLGIKN